MSLLSLTAHWVDPETYDLKHAVLHAHQFRGAHTAEHVRQAISEMLNAWGIDKQHVHVILRDNARTMKKAMDELGVPSLGCIAHSLQLAVHEGLLSQRNIIDALANDGKIIGHFKHSTLAYSKLQDILIEMKVPVKHLQQDVQVRWNSTLYMMQSLLGQKRTLSVYAAEHNLPATLTVNQWGLMERAVEILAPFEELTRAVSSETATTADVIPAIAALKRVLSREQTTDEGVKTMKRTLLEAVERFSHVESDPLHFADPNSLGPAKDALIREVEKMEELKKASSDVPEEHRSSKEPRLSTDSSHGSVFEEILQESEQERRSVTSSSVLVQVQTYLTEQTIVRSANSLTNWRDNAARFPSLVGIAQRYLSAPCTRVDSERLFSAVSNIMDEKRNRLSADRVEKLQTAVSKLTVPQQTAASKPTVTQQTPASKPT
ncbi:hypothetical protein FQN60_016783, partial [Etheostoma spectabile]